MRCHTYFFSFFPSKEENKKIDHYFLSLFFFQYSIGLLPFHMPGFEPVDKEPTFLTNIDVATLHPHGAAARSYAPPGHEAQRAAHQMRVTKPTVWGLYNTSGQADYPP